MKTKEELNSLKSEIETLNKKLAELSEEGLAQVSGGIHVPPAERVIEPPVIEPPVSPRTGQPLLSGRPAL